MQLGRSVRCKTITIIVARKSYHNLGHNRGSGPHSYGKAHLSITTREFYVYSSCMYSALNHTAKHLSTDRSEYGLKISVQNSSDCMQSTAAGLGCAFQNHREFLVQKGYLMLQLHRQLCTLSIMMDTEPCLLCHPKCAYVYHTDTYAGKAIQKQKHMWTEYTCTCMHSALNHTVKCLSTYRVSWHSLKVSARMLVDYRL